MRNQGTPVNVAVAITAMAAGTQVVLTTILKDPIAKALGNLQEPWNIIVVAGVIVLFTALILLSTLGERVRRAESASTSRQVGEDDRKRLLAHVGTHYDRCRAYDLGGQDPIPLHLRVRSDTVKPHLGTALSEGDLFASRAGTRQACEWSERVPMPRAVQECICAEDGEQAEPLLVAPSLVHIYRTADKHVLILGRPGVGKSVALLTIAQELLIEAETKPTEPVPVIFHLATWTARYSNFADWLAHELVAAYGEPYEAAMAWVAERMIVPLLDGLDELPRDLRIQCLMAINRYEEEHRPGALVVSSRTENYYEMYPHRLRLRAAVEAQCFCPGQIDAYLTRAKPWTASLPVRALWDEANKQRDAATTRCKMAKDEVKEADKALLAAPEDRANGAQEAFDAALEALKAAEKARAKAAQRCDLIATPRWLTALVAYQKESTEHADISRAVRASTRPNGEPLSPAIDFYLRAMRQRQQPGRTPTAAYRATPDYQIEHWLGWLASRIKPDVYGVNRPVPAFQPEQIPFPWVQSLRRQHFIERLRWPRPWLLTAWILGGMCAATAMVFPSFPLPGLLYGLMLGIGVAWSLQMEPRLATFMQWSWWRAGAGLICGLLLNVLPALLLWAFFGLLALVIYNQLSGAQDAGGERQLQRTRPWLPQWGFVALAAMLGGALVTLLIVVAVAPKSIVQLAIWTPAQLFSPVDLLSRLASGVALAVLAGFIPTHARGAHLTTRREAKRRLPAYRLAMCDAMERHVHTCPLGKLDSVACHKMKYRMKHEFAQAHPDDLQCSVCVLEPWQRGGKPAYRCGSTSAAMRKKARRRRNRSLRWLSIRRKVLQWRRALSTVGPDVIEPTPLEVRRKLQDKSEEQYRDVWQSIVNTEVAALGMASLVVIIVGWANLDIYHVLPFLIGLGVGITLPLFGGLTAIRQASWRWNLVVADCAPWHYRRFLEYAVDHRILMRVGNGYDFVHELLRDRAADHWLPRSLRPDHQAAHPHPRQAGQAQPDSPPETHQERQTVELPARPSHHLRGPSPSV